MNLRITLLAWGVVIPMCNMTTILVCSNMTTYLWTKTIINCENNTEISDKVG